MKTIYKEYEPNPMPVENYVFDEGAPTFLDGCESQYTILNKKGKSLAFVFDKNDAVKMACADELIKTLKELMYWDNGKPEYDRAKALLRKAQER